MVWCLGKDYIIVLLNNQYGNCFFIFSGIALEFTAKSNLIFLKHCLTACCVLFLRHTFQTNRRFDIRKMNACLRLLCCFSKCSRIERHKVWPNIFHEYQTHLFKMYKYIYMLLPEAGCWNRHECPVQLTFLYFPHLMWFFSVCPWPVILVLF